MPDPGLTRSFFQSRFGRRLLLLFVVCSLLPMTVLAVLSFGTVTRQLREESLERLQHTGRSLAASMSERLRSLYGDMNQVSPRAPCADSGPASEGPACDGSLLYGFNALTFVPDSGALIAFFGGLAHVPVIGPGEREELAAGRGVVVERMFRNDPAVYLVRPVHASPAGAGLLVGEVYSPYLWGSPEENPLIPTMALHVVDDSNRVLFASVRGQGRLPQSVRRDLGGPDAGTFQWNFAGAPYLAAYTPFGEAPGIASPRWTLVLSEARSAVLAPMAEFRRTFPFVALASLAIALLLTLSQLRRHLAPLVALQEGTRRLANQEFDHPVVVSSRDEFAEVAESFNAMADQIARQFAAMVTAAETDRAVLSSVDTTRIVETVLERMQGVCSCDVVGVALINQAGGMTATTYIRGAAGPGVEASVTELTRAEAERLRCAPDGFALREERVPPYLLPLERLGARMQRIFPLIYQGELLGAIALGGHDTIGRGDAELLQAKRVAGQVALALANARMVDQIRILAYYDSLTGLPNRVSFKRRLSTELERSRREDRMFAVCFLDLDHFSRINDTLGHKLGDRLVQEVADRVRTFCLNAAPAAAVARLGGDEFTVILPDLGDPAEAAGLARRILDSFNTPFALDGHEVFVSASVGISIFPADGTDIENLLKNADVAMYQAKRKGRNTVELFTAPMGTTAAKRLTIEGQLRKAIEAEQFVLWYQSIVDLESGRLSSGEALVRWQHPTWGTVLPGEFIPICEETGLIVPLGEWILRTVCAQNRAWQREGLLPIPIAINLSGQQLRGGGTVALVQQILAATGLDPRFLVLELTESILMEDVGDAVTALPALAALGVGLAIDDFGTGYSSLSYLKHFPVNSLKIDQSFIRELTSDPNDAAITSAIIAMGHALGLRVVAEGVETDAQVQELRQQKCDLIQGHWVSRPMPADGFGALLREEGLARTAAGLTLERSDRRPERRWGRRLSG